MLALSYGGQNLGSLFLGSTNARVFMGLLVVYMVHGDGSGYCSYALLDLRVAQYRLPGPAPRLVNYFLTTDDGATSTRACQCRFMVLCVTLLRCLPLLLVYILPYISGVNQIYCTILLSFDVQCIYIFMPYLYSSGK